MPSVQYTSSFFLTFSPVYLLFASAPISLFISGELSPSLRVLCIIICFIGIFSLYCVVFHNSITKVCLKLGHIVTSDLHSIGVNQHFRYNSSTNKLIERHVIECSLAEIQTVFTFRKLETESAAVDDHLGFSGVSRKPHKIRAMIVNNWRAIRLAEPDATRAYANCFSLRHSRPGCFCLLE